MRLGLALGGGGAKGLAHVLMLEALDELGLRPHCVVGTSIGAVIGVQYCAGKSGREIRESITEMIANEEASLRELLTQKRLFKWLEFIAPQFDGTGLTAPPSTNTRSPITTGEKIPGNDMLAWTAGCSNP